jgi:diketogulonate reductase-like aldo/keto reductase
MYRNEEGVGEAIRASGPDGAEVFVASKLSNDPLSEEDMAATTALDRGEDGRTGAYPDTFAYVPR